MSLRDDLDAQMREQLRSRYRPLPKLMPEMLGAPILEPPKRDRRVRPGIEIPRIIPTALLVRADNLERQTVDLAARLHSANAKAAQVEEDLATMAKGRNFMTVAWFVDLMADISGVAAGHLMSDRRARPIARPRQVVMWLARKHTALSLPKIGRALGNRDHTTVMHGANKIDHLIAENDYEVTGWIAEAEKRIGMA